jgi:hypothetical protein
VNNYLECDELVPCIKRTPDAGTANDEASWHVAVSASVEEPMAGPAWCFTTLSITPLMQLPLGAFGGWSDSGPVTTILLSKGTSTFLFFE